MTLADTPAHAECSPGAPSGATHRLIGASLRRWHAVDVASFDAHQVRADRRRRITRGHSEIVRGQRRHGDARLRLDARSGTSCAFAPTCDRSVLDVRSPLPRSNTSRLLVTAWRSAAHRHWPLTGFTKVPSRYRTNDATKRRASVVLGGARRPWLFVRQKLHGSSSTVEGCGSSDAQRRTNMPRKVFMFATVRISLLGG
jgi:hypothetical protein